MNMLGGQIKELHEMADAIYRRSREIGLDYGMGRSLADASRMLREAADTIERLRKQVAKCQIAELKADYDTSRYFELFGTPERAARTLQPDSMSCKYCLLRDFCKDGICLIDDYDALLEWMRGDAE